MGLYVLLAGIIPVAAEQMENSPESVSPRLREVLLSKVAEVGEVAGLRVDIETTAQVIT